MDKKDDVMKMLFTEHHRHLSEIKQKIQSWSRGTIALLAVAMGWTIANQPAQQSSVQWISLACACLVLGLVAIFTLYRFNRNYRTEGRIIGKINRYFGFWEKGRYLNEDSIYPGDPDHPWRQFGEENAWSGLAHHILIIVVFALLACGAALLQWFSTL